MIEKKNAKKKLSFIKEIKLKKSSNNIIASMAVFPSGKIISVSINQSITIYNNNFDIYQNIEKSHNDKVNYVNIKDENNFITCSCDKCIKTWVKNGEIYQLNKIISNAHTSQINKVLYFNENIISCSNDSTVKLWEENLNNNNYQLKLILNHLKSVCSILLIKENNIFISSGLSGTRFYNLNNFEFIFEIKDTWCGSWNALCKIDNDKIIVQEEQNLLLNIISISEKKIINKIKCNYITLGIISIEDKGIILIGANKNIIVYENKNNYKYLQYIEQAHDNYIIGFQQLKNGLIVSYSFDESIKIWTFN